MPTELPFARGIRSGQRRREFGKPWDSGQLGPVCCAQAAARKKERSGSSVSPCPRPSLTNTRACAPSATRIPLVLRRTIRHPNGTGRSSNSPMARNEATCLDLTQARSRRRQSRRFILHAASAAAHRTCAGTWGVCRSEPSGRAGACPPVRSVGTGTVGGLAKALEDLGIVTEMTGQKRNRSYSCQPYLELLSR